LMLAIFELLFKKIYQIQAMLEPWYLGNALMNTCAGLSSNATFSTTI
jgi:hypothetical protein